MHPYRVPFLLDHGTSPELPLTNTSSERLRGVTLLLHAASTIGAAPPRPLAPWERIDFTVPSGVDVRDGALFVRWVRPDGSDWLWRAAL